MTAYVPLATVADMETTPLYDLIRNLSASSQTNLLTRASRAVESYCNRRLAPFTITESHRAQNIDPDEQTDVYTPLDQTAMLGMSRAASLGSSELVRHEWLREYPVRWQDLWSGSLVAITIYRAVSGSQDVDVSTVQYEVDTGHIRYTLGTYLPQGSTQVIEYTGGYSTVPDELIMATELRAAIMQIVHLEPESRSHDLDELKAEYAEILSPYVRDVE